jgi:O-antigen/teichoic acid export membrane protein
MKFPLSAFEPAWQPFVFENAKKENGPREIALIATRMAIVFTVTALGLALLLPDVLIFVSRKVAYHAAAPVVPVIVLAFLFQGFFLLSSIGITITKEARYYPMITAAAASLNIVLNFALIPYFGIMGSAWATVAGYALMALLGAIISNRLYPIPVRWPRIAAAFGAGVACFLAGTLLGAGFAGAAERTALALAFTLFVWRAILDDADRIELRRAAGL